MTQALAALASGVSRTELIAMEAGYRTPRLHQLVSLGRTYKTNGELLSV